MPALIEYIKVGICAGYGDGDFSVSLAVENLSREQWREVQLATLTALACAREHWMAAQSKRDGAPKASGSYEIGSGGPV